MANLENSATTLNQILQEEKCTMSLTIDQIISDVKRLAVRLKEREAAADNLLTETQAINKQIEAMSKYHEDTYNMHALCHDPPYDFIAGIRLNSRELREMLHENQRLQAALDDHRRALEHIMSKYRQHVQKQFWESRIDFKSIIDRRQQEIIQQQADKISEMAAVMHKALEIDDANAMREEELLARLVKENKGLRELLSVSKQFGSDGLVLHSPVPTEDKDVQTDNAGTTSTNTT